MSWAQSTKAHAIEWAEARPAPAFLLNSYRRFDEIEGRHLAIVIGTNLFIALIPLLIVGYAFIEGFNAHRSVGTVIVDNFHLTGSTAREVEGTFPNASSGRSIALSISLISLLITGFDIAATVQLAYAKAFRMKPLRGVQKYLRGAAWLALLFATTGVSLTVRYQIANRPAGFLVIAVPALLLINFGFYLVSPRLLLELPFAWRDLIPGSCLCAIAALAVDALIGYQLQKWFAEYGRAYGGFGIGLSLMAAVALISVFWVWIAVAMGLYWERRAGSAGVAAMERRSGDLTAAID